MVPLLSINLVIFTAYTEITVKRRNSWNWNCYLDRMQSYLSNRRQFVSLFGTNSNYQSITCGVPQRSVLGPLLFLLYINDMPKCSHILEFHLFADDATCSLMIVCNILNLETNLNVELDVFDNFLALNGNHFRQDWKHKTLFFQQQANTVFYAKSKKTPALSTPLSTPSCAQNA